MLDVIEKFEKRLDEINEELIDPEIMSDQSRLKELSQERRHVEEIIEKGKKYKKCLSDLEGAKEIIAEASDEELVEMARDEKEMADEQLKKLEEELSLLVAPRDPADSKNAMMEIRAGTGGNEAAIFAGDLYRMYNRFAEKNGYKIEILSSNPIELGGFKEIIIAVKGDFAYGNLKFESGVHRVQRVPVTESSGRIHTSAASVAVLLEAEDIDIEINENDLKIDVYRSSGPGGQSVNTTDSAVRITHIPTDTVVTCQDEKSQHKNKARAMQVLRARLYDKAMEEKNKQVAAERKSMVGTGDRSAKIRTYNYPQSRVTDHRIKLTLHNLDEVLDGSIMELITALRKHEQEIKLSAERSEIS